MSESDQQRWDRRFLALADHIATWSKDPSRGVGAVIVAADRRICATGYNGLPAGVEDRPERLERPAKYDLICHAEVNAIVQCARHGVSSVGTTIYTSFFPCNTCTLAVIQAGISRVVSWRPGQGDEHWEQSIATSRSLLSEAGVQWCELERRQGEA
ncbi:MAG: dCMP deaminase family protein [Phycisphaerales bacterium]|nr:dCMP deaminase family protein [Phycisphaerales bacterium]